MAHKQTDPNPGPDLPRDPLPDPADVPFRALLEAAPDAMVIVDDAGLIKLVNAQTESMFGYAREELLGRSVDILVPERFRGHHSGHRLGYMTNGQVRPMGVPARRLADPDDENGRGLMLVESLASAWGARPTRTGKSVWFTLGLGPTA